MAINVKTILIIAILTLASVIGIFGLLEYNRLQNRLILATTTSTYDSGLLDYLLPTFESQSGIYVEILSVGTGQAIQTAQAGNADVLLVHSRSREDKFVIDGYGVHRVCVMYNDFIIIGPSSDPANIKGETISNALTKLKNAGTADNVKFFSRGDSSGTHTKELELWEEISFNPNAAVDTWYFETGAGMSTTLTITNENNGYTLIDRGTWLSVKENVDSTLLVEGDEILLNPYGAILVNQTLHPHVKYNLAVSFIGFLVSEIGQELIGSYRKNNEILFYPTFGKCDETHNCSTTVEEVDFWKDYNGGYLGPSIATSTVAQF